MRKFVGFASVAVLAVALGACSTEPAAPNTGLPTSTSGLNTNENLNGNLNANSNSNLNSNLSSNFNTNSNLNSNFNTNTSSNSNLNSNFNTNTSSNSNLNSNASTNSNSNRNLNTNSNSNANSNSAITTPTLQALATTGTLAGTPSAVPSNSNTNSNSNSNTNGNTVGPTTGAIVATSQALSSTSTPVATTTGSTGTSTAAASDVIQQLVQNGDFTTLLTALRLTGLDQTLAQAGPVTIFAPTDQAFAQLSPLVLQQLLADPTKLQSILSYHVVNGNLTSAQLAQQTSLTTLEGQTINISTSNNQITINNSAHVTGTFESSDSSVYVIDKVLIPSNVNINQ